MCILLLFREGQTICLSTYKNKLGYGIFPQSIVYCVLRLKRIVVEPKTYDILKYHLVLVDAKHRL